MTLKINLNDQNQTYLVVFLMCSVSYGKRWLLLCWYWWNYWPSLYKHSFHK